MEITEPANRAMHTTSLVASFAAWGLPAPSSLETRVLYCICRRKIRDTNQHIFSTPHVCLWVSLHLMAAQRPDGTMNMRAPVLRLQNSVMHNLEKKGKAKKWWIVEMQKGVLVGYYYHIDNTEVSSLGLGRRPERSTRNSNDHHSRLRICTVIFHWLVESYACD